MNVNINWLLTGKCLVSNSPVNGNCHIQDVWLDLDCIHNFVRVTFLLAFVQRPGCKKDLEWRHLPEFPVMKTMNTHKNNCILSTFLLIH